MSLTFYCGVAGEKRWNHHPVAPGEYTCISPVTGMKKRRPNSLAVPADTKVIQDSGAFSDNWSTRLTYQQALDRQRQHADKFKYAAQITHRASYDLLIDEVWDDNGTRHKRRWTVERAWAAVDETVGAAAFIDKHREGLGLIQSAQGVDAPQYLECVKRVLDYIDPVTDMLGLGGWCIIGKMPKVMMPVFSETLRCVIPLAAKHGIQRVHIWGVIYPKAIGQLLWMCDQYGLAVSTDSAGPQRNPAFGEWGYGEWRDNSYQRHPPETRGLERARHVKLTRDWLAQLQHTHYYQAPPLPVVKPVPVEVYRQLELFVA